MVMVGVLNGFMFGVNGQMKRVVAWGADKDVTKLNVPQVRSISTSNSPQWLYCQPRVRPPYELWERRM